MTRPTCYHEHKRVVWSSVDTHGEKLLTRQLRHQCADCGRLLSNALPHSMACPATPPVDLEAIKNWARYDKDQWSKRALESQSIKQKRQEEWRLNYQQYLQSETWARKREAVFDRCNGLCEGCRGSSATAVHHLTYDHLGHELLWELAAVCRECHERAHGIIL